jgi:hypothetical protein
VIPILAVVSAVVVPAACSISLSFSVEVLLGLLFDGDASPITDSYVIIRW